MIDSPNIFLNLDPDPNSTVGIESGSESFGSVRIRIYNSDFRNDTGTPSFLTQCRMSSTRYLYSLSITVSRCEAGTNIYCSSNIRYLVSVLIVLSLKNKTKMLCLQVLSLQRRRNFVDFYNVEPRKSALNKNLM
jgi:hypothetical protein